MTDLQTRTTKQPQRRLSVEQARTVLALALVDRGHRRSTTTRIALAVGLAAAGVLTTWAATDSWPTPLLIAPVVAAAVASLAGLLASRFWSITSVDSARSSQPGRRTGRFTHSRIKNPRQ